MGLERFFGGNLGLGTKKIENHCTTTLIISQNNYIKISILSILNQKFSTPHTSHITYRLSVNLSYYLFDEILIIFFILLLNKNDVQ